MSQPQSDADDDGGKKQIAASANNEAPRPAMVKTGSSNTSSSSTESDEDWHSTPASPSMTAVTTEAEGEAHLRHSKEEYIPEMDTASGESEEDDQREKERGAARQGPKVQGSSKPRPGSPTANTSTATPNDDGALSDVNLDGDSSRPASPSPLPHSLPLPRIRPSATGRSTLADDDDTVEAGPSSSSAATGVLAPAPALPPRRQPPPQPKRIVPPRQVRPTSMASVMSNGGGYGYIGGYGGGPASPSSSTASPRSSALFSNYPNTYLNRPLPQTPPTASASGSRPSSFQFFSSPTSASPWQPQVAAALLLQEQQQSLPRPLRLQPRSLLRRDTAAASGTVHTGGANSNTAAAAQHDDGYVDMTWLRAHQAAARMARRRQWEQVMGPEEYERHRGRLESHEGVFQVLECFLQRLAHAENDALEPGNFPRSRAEQDRQREDMETMRKETVEALQPLLAYGPSDPSPPRTTATTRRASPAPAAPAPKAGPAVPPKSHPAAAAARHGSAMGLPPTPPLSPYRSDPRRESGMSSIAETSLNGGQDDGTNTNTTWRQSVKRASALFGWAGAAGGNNSSTAPSPAHTTRFSGD